MIKSTYLLFLDWSIFWKSNISDFSLKINKGKVEKYSLDNTINFLLNTEIHPFLFLKDLENYILKNIYFQKSRCSIETPNNHNI